MINIHISFHKFQIVAKSPLQKNAEEAVVAPVVEEHNGVHDDILRFCALRNGLHVIMHGHVVSIHVRRTSSPGPSRTGAAGASWGGAMPTTRGAESEQAVGPTYKVRSSEKRHSGWWSGRR